MGNYENNENGARSALYEWIQAEDEKAQLRAEKREALSY